MGKSAQIYQTGLSGYKYEERSPVLFSDIAWLCNQVDRVAPKEYRYRACYKVSINRKSMYLLL